MKWRTKSAVSGRGPAPKNAPPPAREQRRVTYGGDGTIHHTGTVDVEVDAGVVVAVWFRCHLLPFTATDVDPVRSLEMFKAYEDPWANAPIHSIVFEEDER